MANFLLSFIVVIISLLATIFVVQADYVDDYNECVAVKCWKKCDGSKGLDSSCYSACGRECERNIGRAFPDDKKKKKTTWFSDTEDIKQLHNCRAGCSGSSSCISGCLSLLSDSEAVSVRSGLKSKENYHDCYRKCPSDAKYECEKHCYNIFWPKADEEIFADVESMSEDVKQYHNCKLGCMGNPACLAGCKRLLSDVEPMSADIKQFHNCKSMCSGSASCLSGCQSLLQDTEIESDVETLADWVGPATPKTNSKHQQCVGTCENICPQRRTCSGYCGSATGYGCTCKMIRDDSCVMGYASCVSQCNTYL